MRAARPRCVDSGIRGDGVANMHDGGATMRDEPALLDTAGCPVTAGRVLRPRRRVRRDAWSPCAQQSSTLARLLVRLLRKGLRPAKLIHAQVRRPLDTQLSRPLAQDALVHQHECATAGVERRASRELLRLRLRLRLLGGC